MNNCQCKQCCGCNGENDDHYHQDGECFRSKHDCKNLGNIKPIDPEVVAFRNRFEKRFDAALQNNPETDEMIKLYQGILERMGIRR